LVANHLVKGSYVSLQSALAWAGLIPESVPVVTSVSLSRTCDFATPIGDFRFRHVHRSLLFGYQEIEVVSGQRALVATPAKALLDLVHLQPGGETPSFLAGLRLQNLSDPFVAEIQAIAGRLGQPRMRRAAAAIRRLAELEMKEFESL
jgi:predicted transcriptional regulator of viral defense system